VNQQEAATLPNPPATTAAQRTNVLTDLALTLPIFVLYHIGVFFLPVRNAADVVTLKLITLAQNDTLTYLGLTLVLGVGCGLLLVMLGQRDKFKADVFFWVAVEGALYAGAMRALGGLVVGSLRLDVLHPNTIALASPWIMSLGAGFYEEITFRVVLFQVGAIVIHRMDDLPKAVVYAAWGLVSAMIFAGWHHVGSMGEPFALAPFVFRTVCGIVFTLIYYFRGFAPAVWTHALYDIWVLSA
jgi:hypothetical protein